MSDVTCRIVLDHFAFLESKNVSTLGLRRTLEQRWGHAGQKPHWLDPKGRMTWNEFAFFSSELEFLYTPELERQFVEHALFGKSEWLDIVRPLLKLIFSPKQLFSLICTWLGPLGFRNVKAQFKVTSHSSVKVTLEIRPEDDACAMFFRVTTLMFEQIPRILGGAPAVVSAVCGPRSGRYTVILPPRLSLGARVSRRVKAYFAMNALFAELAARDAELHVNSRRLLETQTILEQAVRERTVELERANRDLSERVRAVQRLEQIAHLGSWVWNLDEPRSFQWSEETYRIFGIDPQAPLTAQLIQSRIHPDDVRALADANLKCRQLGVPMNIDHRIVLPDGTIRWVAERGEVLKDAEGKPVKIIGTAFDLTLQKQYEQSLIAAKEAADDANRTKSTFLANVSHEIRTPMSSVLGFAELLSLPDISDERHKTYTDKILRNGRHLLALIDDVLDLSKIEAGHLIIQPLRFSPQTEVNQAIDLLRAEADEKAVRITTTWDKDFPADIQNDPTRFRQILINIIGNAIKFTDRGEVRVSARPVGEELEVTVEDTGVGIAPEFHTALFQPFAQAKPQPQKRSGTGLGLALARRLARALGGDVKLVSSVVGDGTTFCVRIARHLAQDPRQNALLLENGMTIRLEVGNALAGFLRGTKILIAEDNPDIQELVRRVLEAAGANVTTTSNGVQCLKASEGKSFDLVLMDMQMPELDGFETTSRLRKGGFHGPIVALTAFAMSGERQKCFAAGCNDFLAKPVESLLLIKTVAKWVKAPVA